MTIHLLYFHGNRDKKTLWKNGGSIRCCLRGN
uniref:AccD n=2 Tax=Sonneratia TaxID=122811 RepID=A0A650D0Q2_9MYRT|nr:acetyl-CoA carboxylase carboxyltransferase beta subunit [Sonneratia ovata]YP_010325032.1 AccD [Sonneratia x hainanensis]YP_010325116.1 AccD [Sonneratia caseolaris]YP_010325200.1 AccD [Sonneratia x gulngai]YP_010329535.1 AccD [Sonneratia x zhongcairongii]QGR23631.1 AccD [Sonneratia apetala]QVM21058.1 acetyl-CoA carboxylase carboxyltransferase beta subunit [Sonneratia ovata]UNO54559.1 AccD [Sonneratia x zhongcairongii]UNO54643.1 AccD [Sonneratia x hainanensis]UNO54727.1 AccD [Sonneratia c